MFRFFERKFKISHIKIPEIQLVKPSERKDMSKRKHGKDLFSFGFKKKPPEKESSKKTFFHKNKFI